MDFHIPMVPVPKGRPRMTRGGAVYTPRKTHDAENFIRGWVKRSWHSAPMDGPISVSIRFWLPKPSSNRKTAPWGHCGDLDNYAKTVLDALNKLVYTDDCQICHLELSKHYVAGGGEPGIDLTVDMLA